MTTDTPATEDSSVPQTPRTDSAWNSAVANSELEIVSKQLERITNDHVIRALRLFGLEKITKDGSLESWINLGAYRLEKAEAEVEELNRLMIGWKQRATMSETSLEAEKAEVERLKGFLHRSIQISEGFRVALSEATGGDVTCTQRQELMHEISTLYPKTK